MGNAIDIPVTRTETNGEEVECAASWIARVKSYERYPPIVNLRGRIFVTVNAVAWAFLRTRHRVLTSSGRTSKGTRFAA